MSDPQEADPLRDQVLALAGVAQFALYTHELAVDGTDYSARHFTARQVILCTDPETVVDVFGGLENLRDGTTYIRRQLAGEKTSDDAPQIGRYIGQILKISNKLLKDSAALDNLGVAIDRAKLAPPANATDILNSAYKQNISTIRPRVMLQGNREYLGDAAIQPYVRLQLLAAIRCGVLWRQRGGRFPTLFLRRKALLAALDNRRG